MARGFDDIFKSQEYLFLQGNKKKGLYLLSAILFLTFFALGHILGGQLELNKRMSNPFTNWVNVSVLTSNLSGIELMEEETEDQLFLDSFHISSVIPYEITWFKALERGFKRTKKLTVRSISDNDPLLDVVLSTDNVVAESGIRKHNECDLIITENALHLLDYDIETKEFVLPIYDNEYDEQHIILLMPIAHVVRELPSDVDVLISDKLMRLLSSNVEKSEYINQDSRTEIKFISTNSVDEKAFSNFISDEVVVEEFSGKELEVNSAKCFLYEVELRRELSFIDYLNLQNKWHERGYYSVIDFNFNAQPDVNLDAYYYSINFNELSMVKSFREHAKQKYDLLLSLAQVESRDNFYLISRLTSLLIFLLVILSGFSIVLYLQNIVSNHLEKIKSNLGTLKAFGLSNNKISDLYIRIVTKFYVVASVIAISILMLYKLIQLIIGLELHFRLFDLKLIIIWLAIYLLLFFIFRRLISRILFKPPGDLIYNR